MYFKKEVQYIIIILLTILSFSVEEDIKKEGPAVNHLCSKLESYTEEEEVTYNETYQEAVKEWCFSIPPRCTRFMTLYRKVNKTTPVSKTKVVYECCNGYEKIQNKCVAVCKDGCVNGKCVSPNTCSCEEGWQGSNCTQECEDGWYGEGCKMYCTCKNGAICDKKNGICYCSPGFVGKFCESICPKESYGKECENECKCLNGGICNFFDGTCSCPAGYIGEHCEKQCEEGFYGKECNESCSCNEQATIFCNHVDGACMCVPGWEGESCFKRCDLNSWGVYCINKCECPVNAICDHMSGNCSCRPGWYGPSCEEKCPVGFFGKECKMKCPDCLLQTGTCHHVTGWCSCPAGVRGSNCDLACPAGFYGLNCSFICNCTDNYDCDFIDGTCKCEEDSNDLLCMSLNQNFNNSTFIKEPHALSELSIMFLEGGLIAGLFLFVFFIFCIFKNVKQPTSSSRNENARTTNGPRQISSQKVTDFLESFNKRSSERLQAANNCKKEEDIELGGEEFRIPDCDKASSKKKSNFAIYIDSELTKRESNGELITPQIRYSKTGQIFCFSTGETNPEENVYADVEYETRNSEKSEEAVK
ncbi:hypothetical protein TNCT_39923 [Trichonephila clavata]|uniref:Uncharacterized protein n=1 Tax=Trichonephila clavata TaxID=2740835 RepID=A0A8X6K970_TRICU|nr:hypothetical protein TNCT_39923 [Trichonephila clavata]